MVQYKCECGLVLDYHHDVSNVTETQTEEGLLRTKETEETVGYACTYCDEPIPDVVGDNLNQQFSGLDNLHRLSNIESQLSRLRRQV